MRRAITASLGKMPTTSVRRLISALTRSSGSSMRSVFDALSKSPRTPTRRAWHAEHGRELRKLRGELIGDDVPLLSCRYHAFLREQRVDEREHHLPLTLAGVSEGIAHEMHAATLTCCLEDLRDCRLESGVQVGNDELDHRDGVATAFQQHDRVTGGEFTFHKYA